MLHLLNNKIEYKYEFCQQCGACQAVCPKDAISFASLDNGLKQICVDHNRCILCKKCIRTCPANRSSATVDEYDSFLDEFHQKKFFLAWNSDPQVRNLSSSGGATKTIIIESLKSGFVDGVYSLRKLDKYPSAIGAFYTRENIPSYDDLPNSVYHSIMMCSEIAKVQKVHRLMLVGTSCQLYALERALKGMYDELVKVCIFCKQQKTLECTKWLGKVSGSKISTKGDFAVEYRGHGWPGFVRINDNSIAWERAAGLPFGRRLWIVPGCNICGDPFGVEVNADISVMDPWKIRPANSLGETLVSVHSDVGLQLMRETTSLLVEEKNFSQVVDALGLEDVWRKRACASYFGNGKFSSNIELAVKAELSQRKFFERLLSFLPRLPFICFRALNKIVPSKRDAILRYKDKKNDY